MRKLSLLMLVATLSLVSAYVIAQETKQNDQVATEEVQQDMEEVKLAELPEVVKETLSEKYANHTPAKALKAKKEGRIIYYIKLQQGEEYETIMIDAEGKVIIPENKGKK